MVQLVEFTVIGAILIGLILLFSILWKTLQDRKAGEPSVDERGERIAGKAARYSMFATVLSTIVICAFYWSISVLFEFPFDLLIAISLLVVLLVMTFSFIGFRWYFNKKGDFE